MQTANDDLRYLLRNLSDIEIENLEHHRHAGTKPLVGTKIATHSLMYKGAFAFPLLAVSKDPGNVGQNSTERIVDKCRDLLATREHVYLGSLLSKISAIILWIRVREEAQRRGLSRKFHTRNRETVA